MSLKKAYKLDNTVTDDEPLARYIFSSTHFSKERKRVKRQAFMPYKSNISVMRHKNCSEKCLIKIGKKIEKAQISGERSLKAIGSILSKEVRAINHLDVESDISKGQHKRHANIKYFNNYTDAKIRQLAQKLADKSTLLYVV